MNASSRTKVWLPSGPIWLQILGLLVGGLIVAQLTTLVLTLLLPPAPPQQHSLAEIAAVLKGSAATGAGKPLIRTVEAAPPSLQSPGWVVSERSTRELASLLATPVSDVRLLFYAPPPLAGTAGPPPRGMAPDGAPPVREMSLAGIFALAQLESGPAGAAGQLRGPPPWSSPPTGLEARRPAAAPPGIFQNPGGAPFPRGSRPFPGAETTGPQGRSSLPRQGSNRASPGPAAGPLGPMPSSAAPPARAPVRVQGLAPSRFGAGPPIGALPSPVLRAPWDATPPRAAGAQPSTVIAAPEPEPRFTVAEPPIVSLAPSVTLLPPPVLPVAPAKPSRATAPGPAPINELASRPLAAPVAPSVFGLGRAALVEGEFVAAVRQANGRWTTVRPTPEGFPNSWQRRVLLWFGLSFAVVAPLGFLFARRLARPLNDFAAAAERLGRDPNADLPPLSGPAEVGRAAAAFNLMQSRLKRYVQDRTGMVGAISHDLRTPLARMRFKLERATPALKQSLGRDIDQMEEMITSVLSFMRDEAATGARQRIDLRSLLECAVDEAPGVAELAPGASIEVEADPVSLQRVFENLIGNALKYGQRAELRLSQQGNEAVVEIQDQGPGLSDAELAQVFQPFYRSDEAKASGKAGMGLGLAVSRSAVRAHGGELALRRGEPGLIAEVRLPLAFAASLAA